MVKPKVTRTYGPIHFEDLEPHRFEDLVRQLIYDFKDWQNIEATGRGGSDDGFDVRAYEKISITIQLDGENNEELEKINPMNGNLWMIQCKREKEIGPKKVKSILSEIDLNNLPYGYILATSANFSKKSYDIFREELRAKGVTEFYIWGKTELEDMLHLPKNDRILFTFFGISLVSKRKSKTSEMRSAISIKNKLFRTVGEGQAFHSSVLIRDLKDDNYPYQGEYKDFEKNPRWKEFVAFSHHPLGLWCHNHDFFAYIDTHKKEWDYTDEIDFANNEHKSNDKHLKFQEKLNLVKDFYDFIPKENLCRFIVDRLVKYSDILLVDDKGDVFYDCPHIFVEFNKENSPFVWSDNFLKVGNEKISLDDEYKRINYFPKKFAKQKLGKIYKNELLLLNSESFKKYNDIHIEAIYDSSDKYNFLKTRDVIMVSSEDSEPGENYIQITNIFKIKVSKYLKQAEKQYTYNVRWIIKMNLGRDYKESEEINVFEFKRVYKWELEKKSKI